MSPIQQHIANIIIEDKKLWAKLMDQTLLEINTAKIMQVKMNKILVITNKNLKINKVQTIKNYSSEIHWIIHREIKTK
jgi:hypothetical protein